MNRYTVQVGGQTYNIELDGQDAIVNGERIAFDVSEGDAADKSTEASSSGGGTEILSDLPGKILSIKVQKGAAVKKGDILLMMEALKMEIEVTAPKDGVVSAIAVQPQQQVANGDLLMALR